MKFGLEGQPFGNRREQASLPQNFKSASKPKSLRIVHTLIVNSTKGDRNDDYGSANFTHSARFRQPFLFENWPKNTQSPRTA